jgi:hypothetical protein
MAWWRRLWWFSVLLFLEMGFHVSGISDLSGLLGIYTGINGRECGPGQSDIVSVSQMILDLEFHIETRPASAAALRIWVIRYSKLAAYQLHCIINLTPLQQL